jgi:hypothetical protein
LFLFCWFADFSHVKNFFLLCICFCIFFCFLLVSLLILIMVFFCQIYESLSVPASVSGLKHFLKKKIMLNLPAFF